MTESVENNAHLYAICEGVELHQNSIKFISQDQKILTIFWKTFWFNLLFKKMQTAKNIVVTGGNDGVGKETVRGLYKDGHNLIFGSRNQERNESAAKNIMQEEGGTLKYFSLDLSKRKSIEEFVKNIKVNGEWLRTISDTSTSS